MTKDEKLYQDLYEASLVAIKELGGEWVKTNVSWFGHWSK